MTVVRPEARHEAEVGVVLNTDGVIEVVGSDKAEHRTKTLGAAIPAIGCDTEFDTG